MLRCFLIVVLFGTSLSAHALKDAARPDVSVAGRWVVNAQQSDDGEALLAKRREQQMKEQRRDEERRRRRMRNDPFAWEPEFAPPERTPQYIAAMEERERQRRQMLGLTKFLEIDQDARGAKLTIVSEFETRRLDAGARSQVSLPQGQLADLRSGWDGEWFVIERSSRDGPRISERLRVNKKTDQLEMQVAIKGDTALSGLKVRRVFDRAPAEAKLTPSAEVMGPVR